ncbi:MAG: hypothetical protein WC917_00500 [Bacilli bacterium]|jgi:hypothetical protein
MTDRVVLSADGYNWYIPAQDGYDIPLSQNLYSSNNSIGIDITSNYPYIDLTVTGTNVTADKVTITDDNASNASMYPVWVTSNTGNLPVYVSSSKISFNPSTGTLTTTTFVGALTGNASTASKWLNARNLAGNSVDGSTNVPFTNKFIVQGTTDAGLTGAQFLGALATGIVKNTITTGVLSIATAPDFPILNQDTTGTAQYATNVTLTTTGTNANFYIPFASGNTTGNYGLGVDAGLYYNPNTNTLYATTFSGAFSGTATSATNLAGGLANQIPYQTAPSTTSFMTAAANSILVTNGSNVPSLSTTIPAGVDFASNVLLPITTSTVGQIQIARPTATPFIIHTYGANIAANYNIFAGMAVGNFTNTGAYNIAVGQSLLTGLTSGTYNIIFGGGGTNITTGYSNIGMGFILGSLISGNNNICFGTNTGNSYTGSESSNILFHNSGVIGESNVIRIGTQGTGAHQQNRAFIAGIYNTAGAATTYVCNIDSNGQLGSSTTVTADKLSLSKTTSTVGQIQFENTTLIHAYSPVSTTANSQNMFIGYLSGNYTMTGSGVGAQGNNAFGSFTLNSLTTGTLNQAFGYQSLALLTTGFGNSAFGANAGIQLITGSYNSFLGLNAGYDCTGSESHNLLIGHNGGAGINHILAIGRTGSGNGQQNKCYIAAIYGTSIGATAGLALIDSNEQLGSLSGATNTILIGGAAPSFSATIPSAVLAGSSLYVGTTAIALNRSSAAQSLTGITSIDGYAAQLTTTNSTSASTFYIPFISGSTTGNYSYDVSSGLSYVPSIAQLKSTSFTGNLFINRVAIAASGISWYSLVYNAWYNYMAQAAQTNVGPKGNLTAPTGTYVTSWALREYIENAAGYGWTWESGTTATVTPTIVAELRSSDGLFKTAGGLYTTATTEATTAGAGSIVTSGGIYASKAIINGSTTDSSSITTGAIITAGGAAIGKKLYVGTGIYLPTSGGTASELNFNEENYSHTTTISGIWASAQNITIYCHRIGNHVTLQFISTSATANTASVITLDTVLPPRFRPTIGIVKEALVDDNGTFKHGAVSIGSTGAIQWGTSYFNTTFAGSGTSGLIADAISYCV